MIVDTLRIPARFNGPPGCANGGYLCGVLDARTDYLTEVTLRKPIPVDTALTLTRAEEGLHLEADGVLYVTVKEGRLSQDTLPPPPGFEEAEKAGKDYIGFKHTTAFERCFVCSTDRAPGDGLCIYTGKLPDRDLYASAWVPHIGLADADGEKVRPEFCWAALDCPGAYASMGDQLESLLLGRFTAELYGTVKVGERCVVTAHCSARVERRRYAQTALYGEDGRLVGRAEAIWFAV